MDGRLGGGAGCRRWWHGNSGRPLETLLTVLYKGPYKVSLPPSPPLSCSDFYLSFLLKKMNKKGKKNQKMTDDDCG